MNISISEVMTTNPVSLDSSTPIETAKQIMQERNFRHIPVVDQGKLVGMVSLRDIMKSEPPAEMLKEFPSTYAAAMRMQIAKVMTKEPTFVTLDTTLASVTSILIEKKIGAIPVVHPSTAELVGIVSYIDVLKVCLKHFD